MNDTSGSDLAMSTAVIQNEKEWGSCTPREYTLFSKCVH
jgi:hypothetical protein